ncbi:hypothetical protein [Streptomyces sp. NPDC021020]|uniref:hypothetical protein n=1 Tax=Streptomyces sp. NPDC021020 TaxID=3365109 RepID=UPI0037927C34
MVLAQPLPPQGAHPTGPFPVGVAAALLVVGALAAGLSALASGGDGAPSGGDGTKGGGPQRDGSLRSWLIGLGTTLCVMGALGLLLHVVQTRHQGDGLRNAGQHVIDDAVQAAQGCDTSSPPPTFFYPDSSEPGGGYTWAPPACTTFPREAVLTSNYVPADQPGYTVELSNSFAGNGHVTVTDEHSRKQVCATVPLEATGRGSVTDGPCKG